MNRIRILFYYIILLPIIVGGVFIFAAHHSIAVELSSPTIVISPDVYYPLDEILYLEGRAEPNFIVQVRFQKQGAKPLTFTTKTDPRGEWTLAEKIRLEAGDWEARARTVDPKDSEKVSEWSNPRIFKVIVSGITIGGINIKFVVISLVIVALLILGAVLFLYFNYRVRRLKKILISKEISEAKESVRKGFVELRQNLIDELQVLQSRKDLSQEELVRKEQLLRSLEGLEQGMQKEIEDIEERL